MNYRQKKKEYSPFCESIVGYINEVYRFINLKEINEKDITGIYVHCFGLLLVDDEFENNSFLRKYFNKYKSKYNLNDIEYFFLFDFSIIKLYLIIKQKDILTEDQISDILYLH